MVQDAAVGKKHPYNVNRQPGALCSRNSLPLWLSPNVAILTPCFLTSILAEAQTATESNSTAMDSEIEGLIWL